MKLILILVNIMKKIQVDNNGKKYILFRIDVYFTKYCLAVEIDEKGHTDRDLKFEQKRQEALEKKLNCKLKDEIEKLKLHLANLGVKNNDVNDKKINNTVTAKIYFINRSIVLLLTYIFYNKRSIVLLSTYIFYNKEVNSTTIDLISYV